MKQFIWRIRYQISQWLVPHQCEPPPLIRAKFLDGPVAGRECVVRFTPGFLNVPNYQTPPMKVMAGNYPIICSYAAFGIERYRFDHAVYVHDPPKAPEEGDVT